MFWTGSMASSIGLDVGVRRVHAAQVSRDGRVLRAGASAPRPAGGEDGVLRPEDAAWIASWLMRQGFTLAPLSLALPAGIGVSAPLELPPAGGGAPLASMARQELARAARCEPGAVETVMWTVPPPVRGGEATHALGVAAPTAALGTLVRVMDSVGLEVEAIESREWALARGAGVLGPGAGLRCVVELGWEGASVVLAMQGTVVFSRRLELAGMGNLYAVIRDRLGVDAEALDAVLASPGLPGSALVLDAARGTLSDFADAVEPEVRRSLAYAAHRYPDAALSDAVLAGEGASLPGVRERLDRALATTWRLATPGRLVRVAGPMASLGADAGLTAAMGLALRGRPEAAPREERGAA